MIRIIGGAFKGRRLKMVASPLVRPMPAKIKEAVRINEEARLRALKIGLLIMAALSLLAIFPAGRLPNYKPGEIPANPPPPTPKREDELEGA